MKYSEPSARPTLGVVAISRNEEKDLPGFFEHLLPWVDEIVIVDDGSTDRTAELARAAGAKVKFITSPRKPGEFYSHQRNKGIDAATSDWLLHMDIDERLTPELATEITAAIRDPSMDAYRYRRLDFSLHRPLRGLWRPWNHIQLARRTRLRFEGKIHETGLLEPHAGRVGQLEQFTSHLKEADYVERVRKNLTYMQAEAEKMLERGARIRWFDFLIHPIWRALKFYFVHGGFRHGVVGVLDGMFVLTSTFNWYATAWDRANAIRREEVECQLRQLWQRKGTAQ